MSDLPDDSHLEGPYDTLSQTPRPRISNTEFARFIDFIEKFEDETEQSLSMSHGYRELRMMIHLMRNHLAGRMTTPTSLADASGLSYGTAKRGIENILERGLIISRPRTKTGKTVSLHPSPRLLEEWEAYASRIKSLLESVFGMDVNSEQGRQIFLGVSYSSARVISPPTVLPSRLELKGGLRVLMHADPTFMAMHNLKRQLEIIFGLEIKNKAKSIDALREEILANARLEKSRYDIMACDLPWFGELASKGALMPLDQLLKNGGHDLTDFHSVAIQSSRYQGKQYGIPVQTTPELLCYRQDLFEQEGIHPPKTSEGVVEAAKRLHAPKKGQYGIAWNAARGTPLGHSFAFIMATFGQPIINLKPVLGGFEFQNVKGEEHRPMFTSDAAFRTVEYMLDLLKYSPPGILDMSWYSRAKSYASGQAAMAYCYTLLAPLFELKSDSPARKNTGYLPHPAGPESHSIAPIGGYSLAIPANIAEDRLEDVWTALQQLTSASMTKLYLMNGSLANPRFSVSNDPEVSSIAPCIATVDRMAKEGILQAWPRPPVPEITELIGIAGHEIFEVLDGRRSIKKALSMAQDKADKLMRRKGYY
ncbi:ABC transporter substrate-binding protein [Litchfieldella rifensis]|uniref:ABC transporter substrate-binding protein n=1 Tax=Litchfieldella rifensis TaxID=762643 RepID=A0ABV7LMU7_9GAMM